MLQSFLDGPLGIRFRVHGRSRGRQGRHDVERSSLDAVRDVVDETADLRGGAEEHLAIE